MKTIKLNILTTKMFLVLFCLLMLFSVDSQAKKYSFLTSSVVPAARGYAKVTRDKNRNYRIKVNVWNLAEIQRLEPLKQTYVVWMISDRDITENLGRLNSSTKLLSKQLKASVETVSSFKPTQIFITAEDDPNVKFPGVPTILTTNSF